MTSSDLSLWMAYYKVEAEDEEKAMKKGGPKSEKQPASQLKHSLTAFGQKQGSSK